MPTGQEDWSNAVLIVGEDIDGNKIIVAVNTFGQILAVFKGDYEGELKTIKVDEEGYIIARLQGRYGTTWVNIACDEDGRLTVSELAQTNVQKDLTEAQTWDDPLTSLLSNLNRLRYAIITLTGEDWGTFTSILSRIATHAALSTGVHGAGANTLLYSDHNVAAAHGRTNIDGVAERIAAIDVHAAWTSKVHGVSESGFEDKANKDSAGGYAALSADGSLLVKSSAIYIPRDASNYIWFVERTSAEAFALIVRNAANTYSGYFYESGALSLIITGGALSALGYSIIPLSNNVYDLGSATNKYANMWTVVDHVGDLVWLEKTCYKCNLPFNEFDEIVMVAVSLDEGTRTVPEHIECTRAFKDLERRIKRLEEVIIGHETN